MKKIKQDKGITLIALVITIIVLLILAFISVETLRGENGILTKANTAKIQTEIEEIKEQAKIDIADWIADKMQKREDATVTNKTIKEEILVGKSYVKEAKESSFISQKGEYEIHYSDLYKILGGDSEAGDKPPIPTGFYEVGGTIEEGFVISDIKMDDLNNSFQGNQFVWVPVPDIDKFEKIKGYMNEQQDQMIGMEPYLYGYDGENTDYDNMKAKVKEKGGFYIGRFEAGKDNSGNVVVKKGAKVYNNVPWGNALNDIEGTSSTGKVGAVKLAKEFKNGKAYENSVTSTLVYGVQWDATMLFMDENYNNDIYDAKSFVKNSSNKGWYNDNYNNIPSTGNTLRGNPNNNTGVELRYKDNPDVIVNQQKNIYDMAGNVNEWTMESLAATYRIVRGGSYLSSGSDHPASSRCNYYKPYYSNSDTGFRIALYL